MKESTKFNKDFNKKLTKKEMNDLIDCLLVTEETPIKKDK